MNCSCPSAMVHHAVRRISTLVRSRLAHLYANPAIQRTTSSPGLHYSVRESFYAAATEHGLRIRCKW